jgi:hypothetical protein
MANWTFPQDIEDRWIGDDFPENTDLVEALLLDAELIIKSEYPRIQERVDNNTLDIEVIKFVVARMVSRVLRNPEGLSYIQQSTGPFAQARNYDRSSVDMWITEQERDMLAPNSRGKAKSIDTLEASREAYREAGVGFETGVSFPEYDAKYVSDEGSFTIDDGRF